MPFFADVFSDAHRYILHRAFMVANGQACLVRGLAHAILCIEPRPAFHRLVHRLCRLACPAMQPDLIKQQHRICQGNTLLCSSSTPAMAVAE